MNPMGTILRTIYRPSPGTNVDGVYTKGAEASYTMLVAVQPVSGERRANIYDSFLREQALFVALTKTTVETANGASGHTGDEIEIKGRRFVFHSDRDNALPGAPLPHHKYYLVSSEVQS